MNNGQCQTVFEIEMDILLLLSLVSKSLPNFYASLLFVVAEMVIVLLNLLVSLFVQILT